MKESLRRLYNRAAQKAFADGIDPGNEDQLTDRNRFRARLREDRRECLTWRDLAGGAGGSTGAEMYQYHG